jgi:hypothetical protein
MSGRASPPGSGLAWAVHVLGKATQVNDQGLGGYASLASQGPIEPALGHAFLTLVEPHNGHDAAYTRWYEDDHFHAAGMSFPWWFAGRRWVATRALRQLRDSSLANADLDRGWSFATYWITRGRLREQALWLESTVGRLLADGRMFAERTHVMTGFFDHVTEWQAPGHQPRAVHALEYPYAGVVLEVVDPGRKGGRWLKENYVKPRLARGEAAQCLAFRPVPWPGQVEPPWQSAPPDRTVLLWFVESGPADFWEGSFGTHRAAVEAAGGMVDFVGGFVPTLPGTDVYLDQLR